MPRAGGCHADFNPPTPCEVGRTLNYASGILNEISIHPPRAGWTIDAVDGMDKVIISIHPPRVEWDTSI